MRKVAYEEMFENEDSHAWYQATRELMFSFLEANLKKRAAILDAGCGTGGTISYINRRRTDWNIYGIDSSQTAIKYCKRRMLKNILKGSLNSLPYKNNFFDVVICSDVLYHQGVNPALAIKEFNRVLKNKGQLYLQEPAYQMLFSKHDKVVMTKHRYTKKELANLLTNNFKIKKITYFNFLLFPIILIKRLLDKRDNDLSNSDVKRLPLLVNRLLFYILTIESIIIRYTNLPYGLSIICVAKKK